MAKDNKIEQDRFYSDKNLHHLEGILQDIKNGKARFAEHELTEIIPGEETVNAMIEAEKISHDSSAKRFNDVEEALRHLKMDEQNQERGVLCE